MYNIEKVRKEFKDICESQKVQCVVPIEENSRLTRTLGRVMYERHGGIVYPNKVEFSKSFLSTSTDECIHSVIQHEAAHFIVTKKTGENHGHDSVFKDMCAKLGCSNDKTTTEVECIKGVKSNYKYSIICPGCHQNVGNRTRKCNLVNHPEEYECCECGHIGLTVVENF